MLLPKPPQPVGRRRAVAEMIVAYKQAATIVVGHVYEVPVATPAAGGTETLPEKGEAKGAPLSQSGHDTPV